MAAAPPNKCAAFILNLSENAKQFSLKVSYADRIRFVFLVKLIRIGITKNYSALIFGSFYQGKEQRKKCLFGTSYKRVPAGALSASIARKFIDKIKISHTVFASFDCEKSS